MNESVIDFPKESLCLDVWEKVISFNGMTEVWQIKPDVYDKIKSFILTICNMSGITDITDVYCHIVGSITSNSYTENADIDIHILAHEGRRGYLQGTDQEIQKKFSEALSNLRNQDEHLTYIDNHPFEIYFQPNKFQDYMSVGCYDLFDKKWIVGPEILVQGFNPYYAYYRGIQHISENIVQRIRNMILSIYEIAIVYKKNIDQEEMASSIRSILVSKLSEVQKLYDSMREMRKTHSSPKSEEEAFKFKNSKEWKVANAAFKLFDKYGYIAILKQFIENYEIISVSSELDYEIIENILSTVKNYINNADKLSEDELYKEDCLEEDEEQLDEGIKDTISSFTLALALLIPGLVSSKTLQNAQQKLNVNQHEVEHKQNIYNKQFNNYDPNEIMNGYKMWQACNILALTLYGEGRGEIKYGGLDPITDVILNRTAVTPDISRIANICVGKRQGKAYQFSFWNDNKNALKIIKNGKPVIPASISNKIERKAWEECLTRAIDVYTGKYKVKNKNINSYHVKNMSKLPSWSNQMKNVKIIGSHKFGYIKTNDPNVMDMATMTPVKKIDKNDSNIYIIKKGDSLWKIAKQFNTTVNDIARKNNITDINKLKIGGKLEV